MDTTNKSNPDSVKYFDNTMVECYRRCERKFYFRHVRHWTPQSTAIPLVFGLSWHSAMDYIWQNAGKSKNTLIKESVDIFTDTWKKEGMSDDDATQLTFYPRSIGRAHEMITYYIGKYEHWLQTIQLLHIEVPFSVPLGISNTQNIMYMGRLDKVYRDPGLNNRIVICDHKTTSSDAPSWYESFSPNSQIDGYLYAGNMLYGSEFWGIMIDGATVMKGTKGKEKRSDRDMPIGISFPRIPMSRQLNQLDAWHWEVTDTIMNIMHDIDILDRVYDAPYLPTFPKKTTSCFCYGSCIYKDICKMIANPHTQQVDIPDGFIISEWSPMKTDEGGNIE